MEGTAVLTRPRVLLQAEGAALLFASLYFYHLVGVAWWIFLLLFLWPDLFMVGFLFRAKIGCTLYNLVHTEVLAIALAVFSFSTHRSQALAFSLIWLAHIGFDRAIGFGLKYPTTFNDTHLQHVS
jgi:hypothetical protein